MDGQPLDDAAATALGRLASAPDASDEALASGLDGAAAESGAIARARDRFAIGDAHWFRCGGEACRVFPGPSGLGAGSPCVETVTGCQGRCERAPVGVLRVGTRCETYAGFAGPTRAFGDALRAVAAAGHFWVAGAEAQRIDPVHDAPGAAPAELPLAPFAFLVGHFRGVGGYPGAEGRFFKELVGSWDAGAQVLSLRMAVGFPLRDGRRDRHEALVLIRRDERGFVGHAFADGGGQRDYRYQVESDGTLCFDDRAPGHGDRATRARKRLIPTECGYDERLEVERDDGFALYSEVAMVRCDR